MLYVDDVGWVVAEENVLSVLTSILLIDEALGLDISLNLGYQWDLDNLTVSLPDDKRAKLLLDLAQIIDNYPGNSITPSLLDKVTGRLTWATQIAPLFSAELSPFYGLQAIVRKLHLHKAKVGDSLVRSAKVFRALLQSSTMASTTASQLLGWASSLDREAVVVADASLTGLGGVIFDTTSVAGADSRCSNLEWFTVDYAHNALLRTLIATSGGLSSSDIGPLELVASVIGILRALQRGADTVTVLSDNVATVACINRRRAKSPRMNEIMLRLRQAWPSLGYCVLADHVRGEANGLADFLSRSSSVQRNQMMSGLGVEVNVAPILQMLALSLL
ncbi:hypothetical protein FOZ61_005015 [Perkinsus olseni]|uniref:Uncharacterized protein n=1 Tax=Perkinsus olseni TaxID=32597 RepID=A0A7J6M430_PEROL|nr:hypothetical protein FOZ61_005015 [Perkinsus olseni]KAF4666247.1 hypothetical protein FOL46_003198 [Perkinsus olseni]